MTSPVPLAAFEAALGVDAVEQHAPVEVDGVPVSLTLRPADGDGVAAALTELGGAGLSAIVRGGGNRLGFGHAPRRADAFLSTERLDGTLEFDPGEGVEEHTSNGSRDTFITRYTTWRDDLHGVLAAKMRAQQTHRYTLMRYTAVESQLD